MDFSPSFTSVAKIPFLFDNITTGGGVVQGLFT